MKNAFVIGFRRIFSMHHADRLAALCLLLFTLALGHAWGVDKWVKVTSEPVSWEGEYLLVYESSSTSGYVWTGVDGTSCYASATISSGEISSIPSGGTSLTIAAMTGGYSIKINSGTNKDKYIGKSSYANGMDIAATAAVNTLECNSSEVTITGSGGCTIRYNNASGQYRFRYYKSGQQAVQLYKKTSSGGSTPIITVTPVEIDFGTVDIGNSPTKTFVVKGSNLTGSITLSGASAPMSLSATTVTKSEAESASGKTITVTYTPTSTASTNQTVALASSGATTKSVALAGQGQQKYAVHYFVGGVEDVSLKEMVIAGETVSALPDAEDVTSCDEVNYPYFVGWSTNNFGSRYTVPTTLVDGTETISSETSYYAVFAKGTGGSSSTSTIDFESAIANYPAWSFSNMTSKQSGTITANSGTYYGTTGGGTTASLTTISKIASPTSLTAYVSKQTNNTTSSTWYIRVSSNGSTWTNVTSQSATSMSKGSWVELTADLSDYSDVYVQVYYNGSTAVRNIDDLTLSSGTPPTYTEWITSCCSDPELAYGTASVTKTFGDAAFTNTLTNSHGVTVTYALSSVSPAGCVTINSSTGQVTINGVGSATITASFAGNSTYCADDASYTLTVNKADISPTLTYTPNSVAVGDNTFAPTVGSNPESGTVTYAITSATPSGCATINASTGVVTGVAVGSVTVTATVAATTNYNGGTATANVTVHAASYFTNNATVFIQAENSSAWDANACVKAWFNASGAGGAAKETYWLFDAIGTDTGKKVFATVVPATGDLNQVTLQRFAEGCGSHWNDNGTLTKSLDGGSNTFRTTGSGNSNVAWNGSGITLDLYGDPDSWTNSLGTLADQGNGVWTATYNNYAPADAEGESQEFKIQTNYNGWIGNTGSNDNATLDGMHIGSTYNITATLDVKDHSLVMSKTFVKGTVHFDLQGHGSAIADLTNVTAGSKISAPAAPSATGYDFGGWYKEAGCTNAWNFASDEVTETTTLYAKWTAQTYTITSTLNNVSASPAIPASYTYTGSAANLSYTISAASGYRLPADIIVSGTTYTWNAATGALVLTGTIAGNVTIAITAVQTHTVTWLSNGENYVSPVVYDHGATLALPAGTPGAPSSCSEKKFIGWTSDSEITSETSTEPTLITAGGAVNTDATYRAVFATSAGSGATQWSETTLAELTGSDVFVIATPTNYALPNNGGSSDAPAAISIDVLEGKITSSVANELKWNVSGNATDGYVFYPNGSTTTWLYCNTTANSGSNDNIRVGAGTRKFWKLNNGYLVTNDKNTARYLSLYAVTPDFRSYVNTNNGVFVPKFYKYSVDISYTNYITTCSSDPTLSVEPTALDFGNVAVNSSKDMTFTLSGSNLTSNATISVTGAGYSVSPAYVSEGSGTISSETITVTYHPTATGDSQTGTVTISSTGADDKTVSLTGNSKAVYSVSLPSPSNGTVTADKTSGIIAGETVTLTITPSSGYQLASISAADGSSNDVSLTGTGNTRTFTMPASNVTVTATFMVRTDYVLVTNISQLSDGDIITIATMKGNKAEGYIIHEKNDDYRGIKSVTTTANGKIADTDVEYPILLEHAGEVWKLFDQRNEGYLYAYPASKKNYLRTGTSYNLEWIIEITQTEPLYKALIHQQACNASGECNEDGHRYIEFNSDRFSGYFGTQTDGYIYKKELGCDRLPAPEGLTAASITQTTAALSWTAVANANGYEVSLDNGSTWTSAGTSTTYNATGSAGTTYNWKVRATGTGDYCDKGTAAGSTVTMKKAVTVTYNSNGSTGGQLPVTGGVVNLTEGDSYTILGNVNNLTKSGYTFDGWHSSATYNATPAYTIGGSITVSANVILYANWKPKRDTFIDGVHGTADQYGDGADYKVPYCLDQSRATSGDCEQTHYKFIGWALQDADLTTPANIISAGGTRTATGATYYAVWGEEL